MNQLEKMVLAHGEALSSEVLKVDSFLNQQVNLEFMKEAGQLFYDYFKDKPINKIITIESSGIAPALMTSYALDVPLVIAKKKQGINMSGESYQSEVYSFTKQTSYHLTVSKEFLSSNDHVLIIDDFLANGQAAMGAIDVCQQAGATIEGIGIVIEKSFQKGREMLDQKGFDVHSLVRVESLANHQIVLKGE